MSEEKSFRQKTLAGVWDDIVFAVAPDTDDLGHLLDLVDVVGDATLEELDAKRSLKRAEELLKKREGELLAEGYRTGTIVGKNADERKQAETEFIASSVELANLRRMVWDLERDADWATAARTEVDTAVSLLRAFLYSKGGKA